MRQTFWTPSGLTFDEVCEQHPHLADPFVAAVVQREVPLELPADLSVVRNAAMALGRTYEINYGPHAMQAGSRKPQLAGITKE